MRLDRHSPLTWLASLAIATIAGLGAAAAPASARALGVEVWTDRGDDAVYQPGDAMTVKIRSTDDAYLLVYEIDSDGDVRLLYPWRRSNGLVDARHTVRLPDESSGYELVVEKQTGEGFVVAIASKEPFRDLPGYLRPYDPQAESVGYEDAPQHEEGVDDNGRIVGDPYVAMERIRRRVLANPGDLNEFATAYTGYYVHEQVRYPRYLCYDCHRPGVWRWWDGFDPYYTSCSVFDFRVNWAWAWGPTCWQSTVPYYFYVVRNDCPPRYRGWNDGHTRWSSWDGWSRWNSLWGGQLRRYKSDPPAAYTPPPPRGTIWRKGETPPGLLPTSGNSERTRVAEQRGPWRTGENPLRPAAPRGDGDRWNGRLPLPRPTSEGQPRRDTDRVPLNPSGQGTRSTPEPRPRFWDTPHRDPVYQPPSDQGRPREWTPRNDPPRAEPPRSEPPRERPHADPPKQEPRRDPPKHDNHDARPDSGHNRGDHGRGRDR